jgi:menaquinone-specific isochorismate synthase
MTLKLATEPALHEEAHSFTQGEWSRRCQRAQELLAGACRKVVLARSTQFQIMQGAWQDLLCAMAQDGCSSLWIEQPDGGGWMATTPETLFHRLGSHLQTEALAGTLRAEGSDEELFARLRSCERRRAEVDLTAEGILEALSSLGARHIVKAPLQMRRFRDWAHLCIPIAADVTGISDESLLEALHPSPAVCGTPRHVSGVCRRGIEGNTSGWYAGACGISTPEWALFVVVLRCAEIRGSMAEAWAGVGLVPGFCAEQEWRELELKLASWRRLCRSA